jgi:putative ABC transport system permease protein
MACFAFITGTILMAGFLMAGAQMSVQAGMDRLGADMIVIPMDPYARSSGVFLTGQVTSLYFNDTVVNDVRSTPGVLRASPQVYVGTLDNVSWFQYSVYVMGFDPETDFSVIPLLLTPMERDLDADQVVVGHLVHGDVGNAIEIFGHELTIVGRMEQTGFSPDHSVYVSMDAAYAIASDATNHSDEISLKDGQISGVLVKADKTLGIDPVLYWISSLNPGVLVFPMNSLGRQMSDQLDATTQTLYLTVASVAAVSMPLVALISTMGANERRREIGLLRAMGAPRAYVFKLIFTEAMVLAIIGGVIGAAGSSIVLAVQQQVVTDSLRISFLWPSMATTLTEVSTALAVTAVLAGLAALWPALRASKMEPYESMRRGQT